MENRKKEKIFDDILKAREYAYLGMYVEALSHFDVGIQKIKDKMNRTPNDKTLQNEWKTINAELQVEISQCKRLRQTIITGKLDFQEPARAAVDERGRLMLKFRDSYKQAKRRTAF